MGGQKGQGLGKNVTKMAAFKSGGSALQTVLLRGLRCGRVAVVFALITLGGDDLGGSLIEGR